MLKGLAAIAAVYLCLGALYAVSDASGHASDAGRVAAGRRQYPGVHEACGPEGLLPGCHQPDPYLLTWEK
jgi:hypothetical protein